MKSIETTVKTIIENKGYSIDMFDDELLEGYQVLIKADIEIPNNLINPEINTGFFGIYSQLISEGSQDLKLTLPYLRPGMTFTHCKEVERTLEKENNNNLLSEFETHDKLFSNPTITKKQKGIIASILARGGNFHHLLEKSDDEIITTIASIEQKYYTAS